MDRRSALKRLAAGSAVAVGASAIVSQPAFAYANPSVTGSPTVTVTTTGIRNATINISNVPAGTCPQSAVTKPAPVRVSLAWETYYPAGNVTMSSGSGTAVSIPTNYGQWYPDDRIRVTMVYRYQCVYAGRTTTICVRWYREFSNTGGFGAGATWSLVGASSTGPTVVACPAGLVAAPLTAPIMSGGGRPAYGDPTPEP